MIFDSSFGKVLYARMVDGSLWALPYGEGCHSETREAAVEEFNKHVAERGVVIDESCLSIPGTLPPKSA